MKIKRITSAALCAALTLSLTGCFSFKPVGNKDKNDETTTYYYTAPETTTSYYQPETTSAEPTSATIEPTSAVPESTTAYVVTVPTTSAQQPVTQAQPETTAAQPDYSTYTKAQILSTYAEALKKTRAYTGSLTVHHTETFTGQVDEVNTAFGQGLATQLANYIMGVLEKPTEENLVFSGGKAVNSDGETVPILLPQKNEFALTESGIASASISESGGNINVHITLVREQTDFGGVPPYNSRAIGYLDTSKFSFNIVTINSCTITYTGSTIDAVIRPDGYIGNCKYVINLSTTGEVSGLGVSGSGTISGAQTEIWDFRW